jgi:hypothetical protein
VVVCHLPLDVEGGLDVALPGPALLYLQLADAQSPLDGPRPVGEEDRARVGDEGLGRAVLPHRPVEDGEEGVQILPVSELARTALEKFSSVATA